MWSGAFFPRGTKSVSKQSGLKTPWKVSMPPRLTAPRVSPW